MNTEVEGLSKATTAVEGSKAATSVSTVEKTTDLFTRVPFFPPRGTSEASTGIMPTTGDRNLNPLQHETDSQPGRLGSGRTLRLEPSEPEGADLALEPIQPLGSEPFHFDLAGLAQNEVVGEQGGGGFVEGHLHRIGETLHPGGHVHTGAEQVVYVSLHPDERSDDRPSVDTDPGQPLLGMGRVATLQVAADSEGGASYVDGVPEHDPYSPGGKETRNTVLPGADSTVRSPRWSTVTIRGEMASPNPVPAPGGLVVKKASKMRSRSSGGIPGPSSSISTTTTPSSSRVRRVIRPPGPVASAALARRFVHTWLSSLPAAVMVGTSGEKSRTTSMPSRRCSNNEIVRSKPSATSTSWTGASPSRL